MKFSAQKWKHDLTQGNVKGMLFVSFPVIQKMGISVKDLLTSSTTQAQAMQQVIKELPAQQAIVSVMDLSVEAEAFGAQVQITDNEIPAVRQPVVHNEEEIEKLEIPAVDTGRCPLCIEAIRQVAASDPDRPLFAGTIGPFSLAGRLMDVNEIMIRCSMEPAFVHKLVRKAADFLKQYIQAFRKAGASGVILAEPLAGLISPLMADEFSCAYIREIADAVQDDSFAVIYHNCGPGAVRAATEIFRTGCFGYHFGNSVKLEDVLKNAPEDALVFGNLDPVALFRNGTTAQMDEAVKRLMDTCGSYPNFVMSSGCDIPVQASWENIEQFFESLQEHGKRNA